MPMTTEYIRTRSNCLIVTLRYYFKYKQYKPKIVFCGFHCFLFVDFGNNQKVIDFTDMRYKLKPLWRKHKFIYFLTTILPYKGWITIKEF